MRVQVLEKENSLLSEEKVGVMKMGAALQWCVYSESVSATGPFLPKRVFSS